MKKHHYLFVLFLIFNFLVNSATAQSKNLKLVFIRHAERPDDGDNLTCQGINRSILLPSVLYKKFGRPQNVYVPSLNLGNKTKRARMLETISPFVSKYNLNVNSQYDETDYKQIGKALLKENGTIIIVWEHKNIEPILSYLGVKNGLEDWPDNDYDSIWIVTFHKGSATLTKDKENLKPAVGCNF